MGVSCCWKGCTVKVGVYCSCMLGGLLMMAVGIYGVATRGLLLQWGYFVAGGSLLLGGLFFFGCRGFILLLFFYN